MMLSENGSPVSLRITDSVIEITLNRPPANALGLPIIEGLHIALDAADALPAKVIVVSSAVPGFFAAGADIKHMSSVDAASFAHMGTPSAAPSSAWPPTRRCRWPPSTGSPWAADWSWRWRARCASPVRRRGSVCPRSSSASFRALGGRSACPIWSDGAGRWTSCSPAGRWTPRRRFWIGLVDRLAEPAGTARATAWELARVTVRLIARAARGCPDGGRGVRPAAGRRSAL